MTNRVFAVVVTYNRSKLLRQCLDSILGQDHRVDTIVVVNNNSSDDTFEVLETDYADKVVRVHMTHNVGGGGGFYRGMKWAHEQNADWLWLMDDDGIPAPDSLSAMMAFKDELALMNPLVVQRENPAETVFPPYFDGKPVALVEQIRKAAAGSPFILDHISPFNGTLISRAVVDTVGYPKREMFIWGDEVDYTRRVQASGVRYGTVLASVHSHPRAVDVRKRFGRFGSVDLNLPGRLGIAARNLGYIYRARRDFKLLLMKPAISCAYYIATRSGKNAREYIRYFLDGVFDRYALAPSRQVLHANGEAFDLRQPSAVPSPSRIEGRPSC